MSTDERPSAMQRKAGAGRPPPEIGTPTAAKLLRAAAMQAGEDVVALSIVAGQAEETRTTLAPLVEALDETTLLALVEGPEGRYGLVLLDPDTMGALIEMQTTGRVVPRAATPRAPTRTDAVMCADFIDRVLELLEQRAADADLALTPALSGYRYALALSEPRAIPLTLEDIPYRRFRLSLDLGRGAKQGVFDLILPHEAAPVAGRSGAGDTAGFTEALGAVVAESAVCLTGTLHRVELTLSEVADFAVGSAIPIPREALGCVAIEDIDGRTVGHGRLGMANGNRAIRIGAAQKADGAEASSHTIEPSASATLLEPDQLSDLNASPDAFPEPALADTYGDGDFADLSGTAEPGDLTGLDELGALDDLIAADDLPDLADLSDL
ncbi:FliM/FliN family flagellar motor C-terminal domain-containing protein [Maritimibacter sp. UBA3975]|uniref:FliM/FliN family flagellar motor C-terminal domain-containing protein n=1 Tax=Maritimibacter sp. UBA3975 TaxID=1946833 RepID=UPI0025C31ADC|nr:FliM/FliN family flagellar motor C-terminal domain-containing protein [Maritimibacter sp. UBA3975]